MFRTLLIFIAPSVAIGILVGMLPGYKAYEYVWKNADFCTSCHVHDYASLGWKRSSHGSLTTCHDCHHQPLHAYIYESYVMIKERPKFPKDLHHMPYVPKDLCQACHLTHPEDQSTITGPLSAKNISSLPKVDQMKLHRLHLSKKVRMPLPSQLRIEDSREFGTYVTSSNPALAAAAAYPERAVTCMDCHGGPANRSHDFTASDRSCVQCHQKMHDKKMVREVGCRSCHFQEFLTPIRQITQSAHE